MKDEERRSIQPTHSLLFVPGGDELRTIGSSHYHHFVTERKNKKV